MKNLLVLSLIAILFVIVSTNEAYGHGLGAETFPPVDLNGKLITLEVSSSTKDPEKNEDQQISISLIDFNSKTTLRDVTFLIRAEHGNQFLFEKEFKADNGFLVFNFKSENTSSIEVVEEKNGNIFGSLLGLDSRLIHVKGPKLSEGGLYKLDVSILTVDGYSKKLVEPIVFQSGISIPQTKVHEIDDPNFGKQKIQTVTYYDEINNFNYNSESREITFSMPFNWSFDNINQTSVVHEELVIPKSFGDLLVSGFSMHVNGIKLSENSVTIDDFFSEERIIHFIINQNELWNIYNQTKIYDKMNFLVKPNSDPTQFSSVTTNGQFRVLVSTNPEHLQSNSNAKINFNIMDIFLKNRPIAVSYEISVTKDGKSIYHVTGTSTDSRDNFNTLEINIPDVSGIIHINFENLNGNDLASTSIPLVVDRVGNPENQFQIPLWIKNNAGWWAEGEIDDKTFILGIEYLIQNNILQIPNTVRESSVTSNIPPWIKNNAGWWADDQINDKTFVQGLQYLIQNGILLA